MKMFKSIFLAAALALVALPASAHIIFSAGNNPGPDEENILFGAKYNDVTNLNGTSQSGINVNFFSLTSGQLLGTNGIGQADITCTENCNTFSAGGANGAQLTSLGINVQNGWGAKDFIGNLRFGEGVAAISVTDEAGAVFDFLLGNGQNFFTLEAINNQVITQILITSAVSGQNFGFNDFKQPRISGLCLIGTEGCGGGVINPNCTDNCPIDVPEPASVALLLPLLGLGFALRRRKHKLLAA